MTMMQSIFFDTWNTLTLEVFELAQDRTRLVKVRLQGEPEDVEELRKLLLEKCPELVLGKAREGTNPRYAHNQKWSSYGNYIFGIIRKRRKVE